MPTPENLSTTVSRLPSDQAKRLHQLWPIKGVNFCSSSKNILHTAEHDVTRPIISIPASANAVLAAVVAAAMQASIPSASMTVMNTSIVDLGSSSRRTAGTSA